MTTPTHADEPAGPDIARITGPRPRPPDAPPGVGERAPWPTGACRREDARTALTSLRALTAALTRRASALDELVRATPPPLPELGGWIAPASRSLRQHLAAVARTIDQLDP